MSCYLICIVPVLVALLLSPLGREVVGKRTCHIFSVTLDSNLKLLVEQLSSFRSIVLSWTGIFFLDFCSLFIMQRSMLVSKHELAVSEGKQWLLLYFMSISFGKWHCSYYRNWQKRPALDHHLTTLNFYQAMGNQRNYFCQVMPMLW